jgi:hypothetical protein
MTVFEFHLRSGNERRTIAKTPRGEDGQARKYGRCFRRSLPPENCCEFKILYSTVHWRFGGNTIFAGTLKFTCLRALQNIEKIAHTTFNFETNKLRNNNFKLNSHFRSIKIHVYLTCIKILSWLTCTRRQVEFNCSSRITIRLHHVL